MAASSSSSSKKKGCPLLNLGDYVWAVEKLNPALKKSFDLGVNELWGFNHEDAIAHFEDCLEEDPSFVLGYVLTAAALCPNYNNPMGLNVDLAKAKLEEARKFTQGREKDLDVRMLEAALLRTTKEKEGKDQYAARMAEIYKDFSHLADISCLYAESLMNKRPWALWPPLPEVYEARTKCQTPPPPTEETVLIGELLERGTTLWPNHPGFLHLTIHYWELSPTPERGLVAADHLYNLCPDQGHLQHMPSHIYMWVGMYKESVEVNIEGVRADDKYVQLSGHQNNFYLFYRVHNMHFIAWAAMYAADEVNAMQYARRLQMEVDQCLSKDTASFLDSFGPVVWYVMIRFGRWRDILNEPLKDSPFALACQSTGLYAKGMAAASLGLVSEAEKYLHDFEESLKNEEIHGYAKRSMHNNMVYDNENECGMLNVAREVLKGELFYRKGEFDKAFDHLRKGVLLDDNLKYDEPWGWMVPARHALGALLFEQGQVEEALTVFRADLQKMPANIWSVKGLKECLEKRNKPGDSLQVEALSRQFAVLQRNATFVPQAACACAVVSGAAPPCCSK